MRDVLFLLLSRVRPVLCGSAKLRFDLKTSLADMAVHRIIGSAPSRAT